MDWWVLGLTATNVAAAVISAFVFNANPLLFYIVFPITMVVGAVAGWKNDKNEERTPLYHVIAKFECGMWALKISSAWGDPEFDGCTQAENKDEAEGMVRDYLDCMGGDPNGVLAWHWPTSYEVR